MENEILIQVRLFPLFVVIVCAVIVGNLITYFFLSFFKIIKLKNEDRTKEQEKQDNNWKPHHW